MKISRYILLVSLLLFASVVYAENGRQETFDPKGTIFEHLGDKYGWNIWDLHVSLPVIVCSETGDWYVFSSSRLQNGGNYAVSYTHLTLPTNMCCCYVWTIISACSLV